MTLDEARARDAADPLAAFRARFRLPPGVIYLDGNSIGALPAATPARLARIVEHEWGERLIRSWNEADWITAPQRIGGRIARVLGVGADEVIATDGSTSTALYKLIVAAAALGDGAILAEADNFPTDAHVAEEAARLLGRPFRTMAGADIAAAIGPDVAVAIVTHVNYRTGARADMAALNAVARAHGTRILWDLSHSAGAVPLDLARDGAELAVGCGYKYLNGGPGAPAYLHVARALQPRLRSPIAGWWGHAAPFDFVQDYRPAAGIDRFLCGTPPMLSLLSLECGVDLLVEADMAEIWAKSTALFDLFAAQVDALCPEVTIVSPRDATKRGSQIALEHPQAYGIVQALIARGVIGDYRDPAIARFGLTPLYLGYEDVWRATEALAEVIAGREWDDPRYARRAAVT